MALIYELEVIGGPLKDRAWKLVPGHKYRIGRTGREIPLFQDDAASLEHAEVSWVADGWWVRDLGSESGTHLDGVAVDQTGRLLPIGGTMVVGATQMRLTERNGVPAWVGWGAAIGIPLVLALLGIAALAARPIRYDPVVVFDAPLAQGAVTRPEVMLPIDFVRRYGVDHRGLAQRRITDHDGDGRSELWLRVRNRELVVEVDADRGFEIRGELPIGCTDVPGPGVPDLRCGGVTWSVVDGRYTPVALDGAVVWLAPRSSAPNPDGQPFVTLGDPRPVRVSLLYPERLAGFLAARGVTEPVHYILCEEGVPGARAQALTASGTLVALDVGCHGQLEVSGASREVDFDGADPIAIALTATGVQAFPRDVAAFWSSGPDGLFLDAAGRAAVDALSLAPETHPFRLTFRGDPAMTTAIAAEQGIVGAHALIQRPDLPPPRPVFAVSVDSPGRAVLAPGGCVRLEVYAQPWHCLLRRWCTPGREFLAIDEVGCGARVRVLTAPYSATDVVGQTPNVEVAVRTDVVSAKGQLDVLRVLVGVRNLDAPEPPAPGPTADRIAIP